MEKRKNIKNYTYALTRQGETREKSTTTRKVMKSKTKIEQKDAKTMVKKSKIARLKKKRNELLLYFRYFTISLGFVQWIVR